MPLPEQIIEMNEEAEELYRAIQQLKTTYKHVIILRKLKEFSTAETAHVLNWSESKVKMTLSRAMVELEKVLTRGGVINEIH